VELSRSSDGFRYPEGSVSTDPMTKEFTWGRRRGWSGTLVTAVAEPEGGRMATLDTLLGQIAQVDGCIAACLVDPTTGMVLGEVRRRDDIAVPVAAAGATDVVHVLDAMNARLAVNSELEDVIVTFSDQFYLFRVVRTASGERFLLLITLDRPVSNLAMAYREFRDFEIELAS
jgi:hypothetical protein